MVLWVLMSNLIWTKPSANFYTGMKSQRARSTHWQSEIAAERARHCERTMKGKIWSDIRESRRKTFLVVSFFRLCAVFVFFVFFPPFPFLSLLCMLFLCRAGEISDAILMPCFCGRQRNVPFTHADTHTCAVFPIASVTSIIIKWCLIASRHLNPLWTNSGSAPDSRCHCTLLGTSYGTEHRSHFHFTTSYFTGWRDRVSTVVLITTKYCLLIAWLTNSASWGTFE